VDVERIRADLEVEDLASRFFSKHEVRHLRALPQEQRLRGFFDCWTLKEAVIKATGRGLSVPLHAFDVTVGPERPARVVGVREEALHRGCWSLWPLSPAPGYAGAVAAERSDWQLRCWEWE